MRTVLVIAWVVAALATGASEAEACSTVAPVYTVQPPDSPLIIPLEGIIVLEASGPVMDSIGAQFMVRRTDGLDVVGRMRRIVVRDRNPLLYTVPLLTRDELLVWTPEQPLRAGDLYEVVVVLDQMTMQGIRLDAQTANGDIDWPEFEFDVSHRSAFVSRGYEFDCEPDPGDGTCPGCAFADEVEALEIIWQPPEEAINRRVVYELSSDSPSAITRDARTFVGDLEPNAAKLYLVDAEQVECVHLEEHDLLTDAVRTVGEVCLDLGQREPPIGPDPDFGGYTFTGGCSTSSGRVPVSLFMCLVSTLLLLRTRRSRRE